MVAAGKRADLGLLHANLLHDIWAREKMIRRLMPTLILLAAPLRAQTADSVARAAATITAADLASYMNQLTVDSLRDRATPSPGLERAVQVVAAEFQRLGLQPGADLPQGEGQAGWFQRYPIPGQRHLNPAVSELVLGAEQVPPGQNPRQMNVDTLPKGVGVHFDFTRTAYFAPEVGLQTILPPKRINLFAVANPLSLGPPVVVIAGRQSVASVRQRAGELREAAVLYVPAADVDAGVRREIIQTLYEASAGVMVVSVADSAGFAAAQAAHRQAIPLIDDYLRETVVTRPGATRWAVVVWAGALQPFLSMTDLDLDRLRADTVPVLHVLPATVAMLRPIEPEPLTAAMATAPNVVGLLEGADPKLRKEYVVLMAHLDNGVARDNTASVAALLALAKAFRQPGARPRRSLLFLTTSGDAEAETWGANAFAYQATAFTGRYSEHLVATLTLNQLDRAPSDSVEIEGLRDIELTPALPWVVASHPELGVAVADGGTAVQAGAEQLPFVRAVIPSLALHTAAPSVKAPAPIDAMRVVDTTQVVRMTQLAFYLARALATADHPPRWTPEGRRYLNTVVAP